MFGLASRDKLKRWRLTCVLTVCRFKASFPWAKKTEEDRERQYVKDHFVKTSPEETAGNLWIHPTDGKSLVIKSCTFRDPELILPTALTLANEYV